MVQRAVVTITAAALVALGNAGCSSPSSGLALPVPGISSAQAGITAPMRRLRIEEFSDLPIYYDDYSPSAIAAGPSGDLWVTDTIDQDYGENAVVQIAPSGKSKNTFYYGGATTEGASFDGITPGPDGALWITDGYNAQILRMTIDGNFTGFRLTGRLAPAGITTGPDKALWFTAYGAVGRITTKGKLTTYIINGGLNGITAGPDGALWFTEATAGKIGRITTRGKITEYSNGITAAAQPWSIAPGPDGALWFTEAAGGRIGRITTKGQISEYSSGITPTEEPDGIAAGPDGAMWFTEFESNPSYRISASKIARITMSGKIHEYSRGLDISAEPTGITAGPDGNMWFVESGRDRVGRATL